MTRLVVAGGTVAADYGVFQADLLVDDGVIVGVGNQADLGWGAPDDHIDASGLIVMPGAVDVHTHLEDLDTAEREDYTTGTQAAAAGGITALIEHPLSTPPTLTAAAFREKRELAGSRAVVDFGFWGALTPESLEEMPAQWEEGARGFKAFMTDSETPFRPVDTAQLLEGMRIAESLGALVLVHAEDDSIIRDATERVRSAGGTGIRDHHDARPPIAEEESSARAILLAEAAGARLQIVHVSLPEVADRVELAKRRGSAVTMEVCPHHLLLDRDDAERLGEYARCAPPLRDRDRVRALWSHVRRGTVDCLVSDHSPYTVAEKEAGSEDVFEAALGCQVIQESVPLTLSAWHHDEGLPLESFARIACAEPARMAGLYPRKGTIRPGSDADLTLIDLNAPWVVRAADQHLSKNPWTPFEGRESRARVVRTIVRGRTVFADGEIVAEPGSGRFVVGDPEASRRCKGGWS